MNKTSSSKKLSIYEFFKIYPELMQQKTDNVDDIHIFHKIFKKKENNDNNNNNKKDGLDKSFKKSKTASIFHSLVRSSLNEKVKFIDKNLSNQNSKKESSDSFCNEHNEIDDENNKEEYDYYLITKALFLQKNKKKRTDDVKRALEEFLFNSDIIEKLTNNLNIIESTLKKSKKYMSNSKNDLNNNSSDDDLKSKIKLKLNSIVSKLADKVIVKKYPKNNFIIKMNDIGEDCYFLISGKLSILKPMEYRGIKVTYKEYFIYLKSLIDLNEKDLLLKVLTLNSKFLDISNIDEITRLIKVYFVSTLRLDLDRKVNGISLIQLENIFKEFNYTFEDFSINKEKMMKEIEKEKEEDSNINILIKNYISDNIVVSTEDLFLLDLHNIFNIEKEKKAPLVTLYRYEVHMYLPPGSFFGDAALAKINKKRNASIRTEEDCIICSLSNEFYGALIAEENKKLKIIDLQFLCNNFFFNDISSNIFNKYYFPMFKLTEKKKNDIIFNADDELSSVYLLKDGIIKTEISANIKDLMDLIKQIIKGLYLKSSTMKITLDQLMELRKKYLKDDLILESMGNKDYILSDKQEKKLYNLYFSNGFECFGILEFCLNFKFLTTCTVVSDKAILMEIKKEDLSRILQNDKEVLPSYYNFVHINALSLTRRLYFLKNNLLNKIANKINENKNFKSIVILNNSTNDHKQKVEYINSEKAKTFYNPKNFKVKDKSLKYPVKRMAQNISYYKSSKNLQPNKGDKILMKDESSLLGKDLNDMSGSLNDKRRYSKFKQIFSLKGSENEKLSDKNSSMINIRNKILTLNLLRKRIIKEYIKKKNLQKLCIVSSFYNKEVEKSSFEDELNKTKYNEDKNRTSGNDGDNSPTDKNKETISIFFKSKRENDFKTYKKNNSSISNLPHIKAKYKKINDLIKDMKRKQCINSGQKKFIFYRKSKVNKVYNNLFKENESQSLRQKSAKNNIKNYYFKKKVGGYSSIVNPLNNTYFNRQKTFKVKRYSDMSQ